MHYIYNLSLSVCIYIYIYIYNHILCFIAHYRRMILLLLLPLRALLLKLVCKLGSSEELYKVLLHCFLGSIPRYSDLTGFGIRIQTQTKPKPKNLPGYFNTQRWNGRTRPKRSQRCIWESD